MVVAHARQVGSQLDSTSAVAASVRSAITFLADSGNPALARRAIIAEADQARLAEAIISQGFRMGRGARSVPGTVD